MRLRITAALVAILAGALFIAGTASFYLVRRAASNSARTTLLDQTVKLVDAARSLPGSGSPPTPAAYSELLSIVHAITGIRNPTIVEVSSSGQLVSRPPPGLPASTFTGHVAAALAAGQPVSGIYDGVAYAAADLVHNTRLQIPTIALVLESPISYSTSSVSYFLLAGIVSLLVAGSLVFAVTSSISRNVNFSARAAQSIASGDLAARVSQRSHEYPELATLASSIDTMAENLERARDAQRQFLLSISHDLRTPLTSISGYAEAIADGATSDASAAARVIVAEAGRLKRLIGDLLDLGRLDTRHFGFHANAAHIDEVVDATADALAVAFSSAGVELERNLPHEPIEVVTDRDRVAQIVANLLENALKFARERVTVSVAVAVNTARVLIAVTDDGPGIAPDDLPHVFERLYSSGRSAARPAGTGLGLAIVAELSEHMGGSVSARSPLGDNGGTQFLVDLPRDITTP